MAPPSLNPSRIDFVTLRLFCAVAESGSITQGAKSCNLALSAASRRLADFEATVRSRLFHRTPQGVALTAAGHVAMQHAARLFHGFELFGSEILDFSHGIRGHVRLWANMSALVEFLPELILSFQEKFPSIHVEVEEQVGVDTVRALVEGIADVGIIADGTPAHGLVTAPFAKDELVVVCSKRHPLARRRRLAFADCLDHDIVALNRGSSLLQIISRAAEASGKPMRVRVQVRSFDAMCRMISVNLGVGVLPLAACHPLLAGLGLNAIRLADAWADRQLRVATKADVEPTPATKTFLQHLAQGAHDRSHIAR